MIRKTFVVVACFCLWACNRSPEPFAASRAKFTTATVQAVSQTDRHLVINTTDGRRLLIEAPGDVTQFDRIHPGDKVILTYHEGIVADVAGTGQAPQDAEKTVAKGRTPRGEPPTRAMGKTIVTTVRIDAVNPSSDTVTFTRPDGITRTMTVTNPDAMRFAERLRPGTQVQVTYREAAAVSIRPTRR
ncbi:MAG: hypothetical protein IRZ28_19300 [Steroidobacteraceae bacterium]|nr:hypothetical protein [Steroidobacteraceae bacterium]